jgi:CheY-like chemotaxis protein/anti-sigma regulatory factor (Ser/Thr protein kinase)
MIMVEMNKKDMHFETSFEKITHPYVECDFMIIRQVFQNILENAIKYTPKGGHIFFEVKPLHHVESGYETFECRIKDDGIGIEQSFLKHIYEPFTRSETSSTSNIPGTGLGMTIAKSLVTLLGGSIHIESEPGIGTEVILCFEMKLSHKEEEKESVSSHRDVTGLSVLLVEDNKMNSDIAKMILDEKGIHVEVAFNGKEALSMFKEHHYDLILMDLKMPIMNGYECAKEIRKESDVPIVAVSANAFEEDKQKAFMCGMNDYITKPYQIDELIKVIQKNT